ncbi:FAD-dependent oxidoreductase [Arthrobacter sp. PAMC25564]|uniref:FAD-dependent oxidoreductase n=1 Tax=Arthrobacter sp. PAMC25564 TaxID=2565366 RepID=UPI0010A25C25|nr:FAD-dependent oxidoreductase [Arthrobacter sp. PAMC25564]QCB97815.1 FAD-dependent oxidoreductase [Arthrobacter sp. PAMC25564]
MNESASQQSLVVIIGGGYGGINLAKALDEYAAVILVEPKDAFVHNIAALRAVVQPDFLPRMFLPYDRLLARGRVIRDRAVRVDGNSVGLESGMQLTPDIIVLATGSSYPFPAKSGTDSTAEALERYRTAHENLKRAGRVMLLGAGAVGLEFAGEIAAAWPDKEIVLVDQAEQILPGPYDQRLRDELNRQLRDLGVEQVMGSPLTRLPELPAGQAGRFSVSTAAGSTIDADIWFRCYGIAPQTGYLAGDLLAARTAEGYLLVTPELTVAGSKNVYALGDIAAIDVNKASVAGNQARIAAANIRAQLAGSTERTEYTPAPPVIILPLGPAGGSGQLPGGEIAGTELISRIKGQDMMITRYAEILNLPG